MNSRHDFLTALAILTLVGCATDEPVSPPQPPTAVEATGPESAVEQSEVDAPIATPEQPAAEPQDDTPGLPVGTKAPAFELKDQTGENRSLTDLIASGSTALVFYRSADW